MPAERTQRIALRNRITKDLRSLGPQVPKIPGLVAHLTNRALEDVELIAAAMRRDPVVLARLREEFTDIEE